MIMFLVIQTLASNTQNRCVLQNDLIVLCLCSETTDGCSTNCNGNGECVAGHCHCFTGFLGPDCSKGTSDGNYTHHHNHIMIHSVISIIYIIT